MEYSESFKTNMVQKMLPPNGRSAGALADETGRISPTRVAQRGSRGSSVCPSYA